MPKDNRLNKGYHFRYMKEKGISFHCKLFVLIIAEPEIASKKVGFITSKKYDLSAVERNRARRLLRESFRLEKPLLKDKWYLFIARKFLHDKKLSSVQKEMKKVFLQASLYINENNI